MRPSMAFFDGYFLFGESLPPDQRLAFYDAILRYAFRGEEPEEGSPAWGAFMLIRATLDKSLSMAEIGRKGGMATSAAKAETARANGASGGRPPKAEKQRKPKRETQAKPKRNPTETQAENPSGTQRKPNDMNENENNHALSSVKNAPARVRIEPDFLRNAASAIGVPQSFADEFAEIMRMQDWAYINPSGRTVQVTLGNVKTVMGCFWKREKERRGADGDSAEVGGDALKAIFAKTK